MLIKEANSYDDPTVGSGEFISSMSVNELISQGRVGQGGCEVKQGQEVGTNNDTAHISIFVKSGYQLRIALEKETINSESGKLERESYISIFSYDVDTQ